MASDPLWWYLPQIRRLAAAESMLKTGAPLNQVATEMEGLLPLLDAPLTLLEDEGKVLRNGYLDAKARAGIVNDLRTRWLGLPDAKAIPVAQTISEARAEELFDDSQVPRHQVEAHIAERLIILALRVVNPGQPVTATQQAAQVPTVVVPPVGFRIPASAVAPDVSPGVPRTAQAPAIPASAVPALAGVLTPAQVQASRHQRGQALAPKMRGDLRLQVLLVQHAEKAVGVAWEPMQALLKKVSGPLHRQVPQDPQRLAQKKRA
ncbi:hypothetical protein DFAR_1770006 [Desulfarculales bacterium]